MIQSDNTCILINACNRIISHQRNKPIKNLDGVKYRQLNKLSNEGNKQRVIKGLHDVVIYLFNNKQTMKILFTTQLFIFK